MGSSSALSGLIAAAHWLKGSSFGASFPSLSPLGLKLLPRWSPEDQKGSSSFCSSRESSWTRVWLKMSVKEGKFLQLIQIGLINPMCLSSHKQSKFLRKNQLFPCGNKKKLRGKASENICGLYPRGFLLKPRGVFKPCLHLTINSQSRGEQEKAQNYWVRQMNFKIIFIFPFWRLLIEPTWF